MRLLPLIVGTIALIAATVVSANPVTLSGRVAYQEVVRLPPEAVTTVRMLDQDGMTVAETRIEGTNAPPIPFELVYDDGAVDEGGSYALEAEISVGDRVAFRSPKPQPVRAPATSHTVSLIVRLARD